jgi:hypothetical protein
LAVWLPAHAEKDKPAPSGGRAVAHHADGRVIKDYNGSVPTAQALPTDGFDAAEPTLAFDAEGGLFYPAADLDASTAERRPPNTVQIIRSIDQGKTWENVSPNLAGQNLHPVTLDPYVYSDSRGRVWTIDLTVACSYLSYTDDLGESWVTNPLACGRPVNDHQTLFSGPPVSSPTVGYPNIVYYCWNDVASSSCSKSLDGGLTFSPTGTPAYEGVDSGETEFCGGLHGHGVVGEDGTVYLPREYCNGPYVSISKDEGRTWEQVRVSKLEDVGGPDPSVAVDAKGNIYYSFVNRKDRLPRLVYSRDGGKSWSKPLQYAAPGVKEANLSTIDVGAPGKVAMTYYGSTNTKITKNDEGQASWDHTAATWNGYMSVTADLFSADPVFFSGTVNPKNDPIKRSACGPGRCGRVFDFIDVEIGPDGFAYFAFVDACIEECVEIPADKGDEGLVGRLAGGPRLN